MGLSVLNQPEKLLAKTGQGYYFRAIARYKVGRYKEAAADYAKALELDPRLAVAEQFQHISLRKLNEKESRESKEIRSD